MANQITGRITEIGQTVQIPSKNGGSSFTKREFILDATTYDPYTGERSEYENIIPLEFSGDKCADIERSKEENGSKVDNYSQVVDSNLPKSFKLNIPLFKGFSCEEIEVEIYADVDGRDVSLSLVSAGANEAIEEYKNKVIDEQLDAIRQIAPDIVIIEV